jgi:N-succinyldiaminopimelate aminotransferase
MEKQGASQVWAEVTALARLPGVLDLGQGWPEMGASELARAAASEAMLSDEHSNQYSPSPGAPELVNAIERYYRATGSLPDDSVEREVLVTTSATEALYVTLQALCDPGDEVVFLEPFFPWYKSHARIFGATPRTVRLREEGVAPNKRFRLRLDDLRDAFVAGAGKTKAFIHCNPHNPTGLMFSETETQEIARLCAEFDVVIVADEVYERCTFDEKRR